MKKIITFLLLSSYILLPALRAEESQYREDLKTILHDTYVNADDMSDYMYMMVMGKLNAQESSISPGKVIEKFKQKINSSPELEQKFIDVLASEIPQEDCEELMELVQNPLYLKHRKTLLLANLRCWMESDEIFQQIIDEIEKEEITEKIVANVIELDDVNYNDVLNKSKYVIIDIFGSYCPPCKLLSKVFDELSQEYGHLYTFASIDSEEEEDLSDLYNVGAVPTVLFIKNGKEVGRSVGFIGKDTFLHLINKYFHPK